MLNNIKTDHSRHLNVNNTYNYQLLHVVTSFSVEDTLLYKLVIMGTWPKCRIMVKPGDGTL